MQKNKKNTKIAVTILLSLVTVLSIILTSCVPWDIDSDPTESIPEIDNSEDTSQDISEVEEVSTPEGYTDMPVIVDIKNITADVVVIAGTCEENATVTIAGGEEDVTANSKDGYFLAEVSLRYDSVNVLEAVAKVEGKEESLPRNLTANYDATAEKRKDGFNVAVGNNSQLYFESFLDNYKGENLLTQTQLRNLINSVNARVTNYNNRAKGQSVGLIYVLIPDSTSIHSEIFPEDITKETFSTRYSQIVDALSKTDVTVIDMYDIFMSAKENSEYNLYRTTDSNLTEYGAFLVYEQIANEMTNNFPDAAPRALEEFTIEEVDSISGNLFEYLGINRGLFKEKVVSIKPKDNSLFRIGNDEDSGFSTINISDLNKYAAEDDFTQFVGKDESNVSVNDRFIINTNRINLPSALIYRDDSAFPMVDLLAERFNNAMFAQSGDFTINFTDAGRHYSEGKAITDYIIVIVSENNIEDILPSSLAY